MIPESGRSPGEGNGNPLQYSCLENPDRGAWQATVHAFVKSGTQLNDLIHTIYRLHVVDEVRTSIYIFLSFFLLAKILWQNVFLKFYFKYE